MAPLIAGNHEQFNLKVLPIFVQISNYYTVLFHIAFSEKEPRSSESSRIVIAPAPVPGAASLSLYLN
jgi:hypothetical protein